MSERTLKETIRVLKRIQSLLEDGDLPEVREAVHNLLRQLEWE